jgi:hypothetical protein
MPNNPPRPRLALSIGAIGHRPKRLAKGDHNKIESEINRVLDMIAHEVRVVHRRYADFFSQDDPQLTLVSALAEGADRLAAEAALTRKFLLDVPIPFAREVYVADFVGDATQEPGAGEQANGRTGSLDEFNALTAPEVARALLELPGKRQCPSRPDDQDADKAYEMAGLTVIGQSDILLTVWDGGPSGGVGGTTEMLHEAVRRGVPIIEVNISATCDTRICWSALRESPIVADQIEELPTERFDQVLPRLIEEFLRPPSADTEREALLSYLGDPPRSRKGWVQKLAAKARPTSAISGTKLAAQAVAHAEKYAALMTAMARSHGTIQTNLASVFGWADVMAIGFAQTFRRAFVFNFLTAATAVIAALCSLLTDSKLPVIIEIALIVAVVVNTVIGRKLGWHMRWMEAREVAERMRVAIMFWILGTQPPAFFGEEPAWTGWYARAMIRQQGMRSGRLDREGMSEARTAMLAILEHQHEYHRDNACRMKRRESLLEWIGLIFFGGTLLVALAHIWTAELASLLHLDVHSHHNILIMLSAILPALATASYGIRIIGDFEGIAKRSERTEQGHKRVIEALLRDPADLMLFRARAQIVADAMLGDVASWRLSTESRGLAIPG